MYINILTNKHEFLPLNTLIILYFVEDFRHYYCGINNMTAQEKANLFEKAFYPQMNALYNFAFKLTLDEDDANDLVQETYLKAFRFIESFEQGTNVKAWLFRILKNSFINDYRKKKREPSGVDYQEIEEFYNNEDAKIQVTTDLRTEIFKNMVGDEVSSALKKLPVDFRLIILLCDLEGFSYEEIAKIIDIPIGTVRSRLHRARQLLKEMLTQYAIQQGYASKQ